MPPPKAMWRFGLRSKMTSSGSRIPSRRCWPIPGRPATKSPLRTGQPSISASAWATRMIDMTGVSQRSSSSTADGMIDGIVDDALPMRRVLGQELEAAGERVGDGVETGQDHEEADVDHFVVA